MLTEAIQQYIPLFEEVIGLHPVAVRLNAVRFLGLTDNGQPLSRQTFFAAVIDWRDKEKATDENVARKIAQVLDVNAAVDNAFSDLGLKTDKTALVTEGGIKSNAKGELIVSPKWMHYLTIGLVIIGGLALISMAAGLFKKIISSN